MCYLWHSLGLRPKERLKLLVKLTQNMLNYQIQSMVSGNHATRESVHSVCGMLLNACRNRGLQLLPESLCCLRPTTKMYCKMNKVKSIITVHHLCSSENCLIKLYRWSWLKARLQCAVRKTHSARVDGFLSLESIHLDRILHSC